MALSTVTLKWSIPDLIQSGLSGTLSIVPTAQLADATDHELIPAVARTVTFSGGTGQLAGIVANDNANILPAGTGYLITVVASNGQVIVPQFQTQLLTANGATQWLDQLAIVPVVTTGFQFLPLPSGTPEAGQVPAATGSGEASAWTTIPTGTLAVRTVTANTTLAKADGLLIINAASGNLVIGLPNPATVTGQVFYLKRDDNTTSYVTLTPFASELIDGGSHGYLSNSDASISLVSDGTNWQAGPGYRQQPLPTAAKPFMTVPPSNIVTQMQTGHGFTTTGADGSSNLNDTSNFVIGTQAATLVTAGAGATTFLLHKGLTAVNMTGKQYVVVIECDDPTHILTGTFEFLAGTGATSSTSYQWQLYSAGDIPQNVIQAGRWIYYVLNFADATVNGSPARSAITDYYVKLNDDSTGNKVTIRVNAIYAIPDSSGLAPYGRNFPSGAATICFDDGFISQATNAKPVLDAAGLAASMFIIWDQIGLSARLTQAQLLAFQDISGWDINAHSLTDADHSAAFNNLTAAELESNFANQQQIMASQGFQGQGTAYPKGEVTTTAIGLIRKYFQYSRGTYNKNLETLPVADMFNLRAISSISPVSGGYSPSAISQSNGVIDQTVAQHRWLILTFHKIIGNVTSCNNTTGTTYRIIYTDTAPPYNTGNSVTLQGFSPAGLNGTYTVTADGTTGGFGYVEVSIPANPGSASVQGTALSATTDCDLASFTAIIAKLVSSGVAILNMADMMKCLYPEPVVPATGASAASLLPDGTAALGGTGTWADLAHVHPATAPGMKLAKHVYAPASQTTAAASTATMAAFDSTNIQTGAFTAPASGEVTVKVSFVGKVSTSGNWAALGLAAHGTVTPLVANEWAYEASTSDASFFFFEFTVSGLTPGTSYNFDLLGCAESGQSFTIYAFGQTTVTPTLSGSAGQGAPVTLTVLAD